MSIGEWFPQKIKGECGPRFEHTSGILGDKLYIFGGKTAGGEYGNNVVVSVFSRLQCGTNDYVYPAELIGGPRLHGHGSVIKSGVAYLVSGKQVDEKGNSQWNQRVHVYSPSSGWKIEGDTAPLKLFRPTVEVVGDKIYVFGGLIEEEPTNALLIYNVATKTWDRPRVTGIPPSPRIGHTMNYLPGKGDGYLLIFGGHDPSFPEGDKLCRPDLHFLSLDNLEWGEAEVEGEGPPPLYGHTTCRVGSNLYLIGGTSGDWATSDQLYQLQFRDDGIAEWQLAFSKGEVKPEPRYWHSAVIGNHGDELPALFLFGGTDQSSTVLASLFRLSLKAVSQLDSGFSLKKKVRTLTRLCNGQPACVSGWGESCSIM
eukprot:TRINITY_DN1855_c0_g1_i1.p1 TRINITY_DN1855_c0_g1~~TRINITY_DN1855_c0_g1_i1.p1  ORF type:complete len:369 (-),score=32.38 TRINITY_DN1855_c0_g1_i1:81-1187(-)